MKITDKILALASVCSTDRNRQNLSNIQIGKTFACATDGHRMIKVTYDKIEGLEQPLYLSANDAKLLAKAGKNMPLELEGLALKRGAVTATVQVGVNFPDYLQVWPKSNREPSNFGVNPYLIGEFGKLLKVIGATNIYCSIFSGGTRDPLLLIADGVTAEFKSIEYVVMPAMTDLLK